MSATTPSVPTARPGAQGRAAARQERLADAVSRLGTRTDAGVVDRWLYLAGGVLLLGGVVVIALGWYGAAHTARLFEQIPYLISGGLLGLGLVIVGGFLYFAYWLTLLVREGRAQAERAEAAIARIEQLLATGATVAAAPSAPMSSSGSVSLSTAVRERRLVATPSGTMMHRPDCPVVAGKTGLREVDAADPGLRPCRICDPLGEDAD